MVDNERGSKVTVASRLAKINVLDVQGNKVHMGGLWKDHPIVLVFIRHFG
jgi:hypothetical protein